MTEKHDFSKMFMNAEIKSIPKLQAKVKSCPFCGEIPGITQYELGWCVQCLSADCFILPQTALCSSKEEAIREWNTRIKGGWEK